MTNRNRVKGKDCANVGERMKRRMKVRGKDYVMMKGYVELKEK